MLNFLETDLFQGCGDRSTNGHLTVCRICDLDMVLLQLVSDSNDFELVGMLHTTQLACPVHCCGSAALICSLSTVVGYYVDLLVLA